MPGLYDTVFDVDNDKDRAQTQGLEPNGFNFEGTDSGGLDYALNRQALDIVSLSFTVEVHLIYLLLHYAIITILFCLVFKILNLHIWFVKIMIRFLINPIKVDSRI